MTGRIALVAILVAAGLARYWAIDFCLPATICRPDEEAVVSIATRVFARDFNPAFFDWPTLFMYAVAVGVVIFFKIGLWLHWFRGEFHFLQTISNFPAPVYLIARLFSATAGVASVWLLYRIGERLSSRRLGLIAAALLSLAFLHVRDSHFGVTDVTATCFTLAAFLWLLRFEQSQRRLDLAVAALWAGFATSTKYGAVMIVVPILWSCVWPSDASHSWLQRARQVSLALLVMVAAFAVTSPYCLIAFDQFISALGGVSTHLSSPHAVMLGRGWWVHLASSLRYGLGLPVLLLGLAGLAWWPLNDRRAGILVLLFPVVYYATVGSAFTVFARYAVPLVPFLCLSAAYAVQQLSAAVATRAARPSLAPAVALAMTLVAVAPSAWSVWQFDRLLSHSDSRIVAASWVMSAVPKGASIAETGGPWTHLYLLQDGQHQPSGYRQFLYKQGDEPDLMIVSTSPRGPGDVLPEGAAALLERYEAVCTLSAFEIGRPAIYDQQDEFFLPMSAFRGVRSPGPTLAIYARPNFLSDEARAQCRTRSDGFGRP